MICTKTSQSQLINLLISAQNGAGDRTAADKTISERHGRGADRDGDCAAPRTKTLEAIYRSLCERHCVLWLWVLCSLHGVYFAKTAHAIYISELQHTPTKLKRLNIYPIACFSYSVYDEVLVVMQWFLKISLWQMRYLSAYIISSVVKPVTIRYHRYQYTSTMSMTLRMTSRVTYCMTLRNFLFFNTYRSELLKTKF